MAGNAHRSRRRAKICDASCKFCKLRPKFGNYKNSTGHRHNPKRKRKQKRPQK